MDYATESATDDTNLSALLDALPSTVVEQQLQGARTSTKNNYIIPKAIDYKSYAKRIVRIFQDGIQIRDLGQIICLSYELLKEFPMLSTTQRSAAVVKILREVIDITDGPGVDAIVDPALKELVGYAVPPFIDWLCPDNLDHLRRFQKFLASPSEEMIQQYENEILRAFKGKKFTWAVLADVVNYTASFVCQFAELTDAEKESLCMRIVDYILKKTDTPGAIDKLSDPLFREFVRPVVHWLVTEANL